MPGKRAQMRAMAIIVLTAGQWLLNASAGRCHSPDETEATPHSQAAIEKRRIPFRNPAEFKATNDNVLHLDVALHPYLIDNDLVRLRSYSKEQLVGPTIRVRARSELRIKLTNKLPRKDPGLANEYDIKWDRDHNIPNNFNYTNLHTHGLSVSPEKGQDYVFAEIEEEGCYEYCFKIPAKHPAGTFWYHPHRHGSTAAQVSSGMAGAIIVDPEKGDGLDCEPQIKDATENIFVFQQIGYSENSDLLDPLKLIVRATDAHQVKKGNRNEYILINGVYGPTIVMKPGELQRWRCINAGIHQKLALWVSEPIREKQRIKTQLLYAIALDGLPLREAEKFGSDDKKVPEVLPGGRLDLLFQAPQLKPGETSATFYLYSGKLTEADNSRPTAVGRKCLARIVVMGGAVSTKIVDFGALKDSVKKHSPESIDKHVISKERVLEFITDDDGQHKFRIDPAKDWKQFSGMPDLKVEADSTERWTLKSIGGTHPFHIHVNPFEVIKINDDGTVMKNEDGIEKTEWRDTVLLQEGKPIKIRIHFDKFLTGRTVLHCHNLDHEDQGMMMIVDIVKRDPARKQDGLKNQRGLAHLPAKAPEWSLPDCHRKDCRLTDFAGKNVVLVFVRGVGCSHCLAQLRALAQRRQALQDAQLTVVAVCPDSCADIKEALGRFALAKKLPFLILSDPKLEVFRKYGCHEKDLLHGSFLIDAHGTVYWQDVGEEPFMEIDRLLTVHERIGQLRQR